MRRLGSVRQISKPSEIDGRNWTGHPLEVKKGEKVGLGGVNGAAKLDQKGERMEEEKCDWCCQLLGLARKGLS